MAVAIEREAPSRGEVYLVQLDLTRRSEIRITHPCLVVSPDELNRDLRTVVVAPTTTGGHDYHWRVRCRYRGRAGLVVIDQLRTVGAGRLVRRLGELSSVTLSSVLRRLQEMFAP